MNAVLLDYTHPLLEQGLEQGGIGLWREYELAPEEFPSHYYTAEVLVIRSRFPMTRAVIDLFPNLKAIGRLGLASRILMSSMQNLVVSPAYAFPRAMPKRWQSMR